MSFYKRLLLFLLAAFPFTGVYAAETSYIEWEAISADNAIEVNIHIVDGYYQSDYRSLFYFEIEENSCYILGDIDYPEIPDDSSAKGFEGSFTLSAPFHLLNTEISDCESMGVTLHYQLCMGDLCLMPEYETRIIEF
ncbi:MAG TPA: hypothetical protein DCO79_12600 [Spirochaeta sp.]|nr:hypothetical protein [Spirochaeta sp.]